MAEFTYRCRPSLLSDEVTWTLTDAAIESTAGLHLPLSDIVSIRVHDSLGVPASGRWVIQRAHGRSVVLTSNHYVRFGRFEDRSASLSAFIQALLLRVSIANPGAVFLTGMPRALWWMWLAILIGCFLVSAFAAAIIVVEIFTKGRISLEVLVTLPMIGGVLVSTPAIMRLLRKGRSQPLRFS
jgi:hypothetical protein